MEFINKNTIKLDKEVNELDKFVFKFIKILRKYTDYVIVGGYVPILLGRTKTTDEIDIFVKHLSKEKIDKFYHDIGKSYWSLNAKNSAYIYKLLMKDLAIRISLKNTTTPNFKIKVARTKLEMANFVNKTTILTKLGAIYLSPLSVAINFKRNYLKSYRDMEDAVYLEKILAIKNQKANTNIINGRLIPSQDRLKDRLNFVEYWAEYVRTHSDKEWSKQQNVLINSLMQNAKNSKLTKEQYLRIKGEIK